MLLPSPVWGLPPSEISVLAGGLLAGGVLVPGLVRLKLALPLLSTAPSAKVTVRVYLLELYHLPRLSPCKVDPRQFL